MRVCSCVNQAEDSALGVERLDLEVALQPDALVVARCIETKTGDHWSGLVPAADAQLQADQAAAAEWMMRYNATGAQPFAQRHAWLVERLAEVGAGAVIRPPFHCDYGYDIRLGAGVFLNFNCVILDICEVHIGDGTQVGPAVQFYATDHPRDAAGRARGWTLVGRSASGAMAGSAEGRSSCRVSPSATMRCLAQARWPRAMCQPARPQWAILRACAHPGVLPMRRPPIERHK